MKKHIFTAAIIMLAIAAQAQANKKPDNAQQVQPADQAQPQANKKSEKVQQPQSSSAEQAQPKQAVQGKPGRTAPASAQTPQDATGPREESGKRKAATAQPTVMPDGTAAPATTGEEPKAQSRGRVVRKADNQAVPAQTAGESAKQNASPKSAVKKPAQKQATPATDTK